MNKIKTGDEVIVLTGNDRGKTGEVFRVLDKGQRMLVRGIKLVKKHVKPNPQLNQQGGIISKEAPIQTSNLAIYNSATKKADRVGFKTLEDNKKVRIFKSTGEMIDL